MSKPLFILIALGLIIVTAAESAVDNEELVDGTGDSSGKPTKMDMNIPGIDKELPSPEEFLEMLDAMSNLSDEEKDNLREYIQQNGHKGAEAFNSIPAVGEKNFLYQLFLLLSLLAIIGIIFVFFGYKLYKSLIQRDIRREMKKKQKEMKKKK